MAELSSYILAADSHNIGNTGTSWLDPTTWGTKLGNAGKFAATSMLNGANSFYNTGATVASWLPGVDIEQSDPGAFISAIDSDFGAYYRQNRESVDLAGFVLSSIVPGLGGIKLLNAGQTALQTAKKTGWIGENLGKATGLLAPNTQKYVQIAAQEINASTAAVKLLNVKTAKAIGAGLWQNTLEAAAFETVVQATMYKSPVLEAQDFSDVVTNIAVGGALGGVITGAFTTAKLFGTLKSSIKAEDAVRAPFQTRTQFADITPASERIISLAYDSEMSTVPIALRNAQGELVENNFAVNQSLYQDKLRKNNNDMRTEYNKLASGDKELGNMVANISQPDLTLEGYRVPGSAQQVFQNISGAQNITRLTEVSKAEAAYAKKLKDNPETAGTPPANRYLKVVGEDAGTVSVDAPVLPYLGDLHKGKDAVLAAVKEYGFKPGTDWNALNLTGAKGYLEAEARYIWVNHVMKELPKDQAVNLYDIPLLEYAYKNSRTDIRIFNPADPLDVIIPGSRKEILDILRESKLEVANQVLLNQSLKKSASIPVEQGTEAAARIANTRRSYLEGTRGANDEDDLLALQTDEFNYKESIRAKGLSETESEVTDPLFLPKYAKITYDVSNDLTAVTDNIADAVVYFKEKQRLYTENNKNVVAKILGGRAASLPDISDTALYQASRTGSGAGLFSFQNGNYGSLDSAMAWIGSITRASKEDARKNINESLGSVLQNAASKPEIALEFEGLNQRITRSPKQWILDEDNQALVSVEKEGIEPDYIPITNEGTVDLIREHIRASGSRTDGWRELHAAQGKEDYKNANVFRPIRPNLRDYPHFAFVKDPMVTGTGHTSMIHAASEKELAALISKVPSQYKVITKTESEEYFKARGEYDFQRTLHENYINSDLTKKGVFSNFFPKSDPGRVVDDILQQHYREADILVSETIRLRYEPQFNFLEDLGRTYGKASTSKFASRAELIEKTSDNPYFNYIKTALDISKISENNLIYNANRILDQSVSNAVAAIKQTWDGVKTPAELEKVNKLLDEYGIKPAYYDESLDKLANHTAPKGYLTSFVRKANAVLSQFTLGLDPLNALNNAIGSNILRGTELKHLIRAIESGDSNIAGELAQLAKITVPGTDRQILSPTKLVSQAITNFWKDDGTIMARYKADNIVKDRVEQLKFLVDDFTLKGTESVAELDGKVNSGFLRGKSLSEIGEKYTGNKLAEEFNRFISANVMDQITGIAIKAGIMDEATAKAYRNTFVNRVEGNIIASQRPLIFQGPIGQAIGLFQSYQFNLLQQLFRYSAEGSKKDIATLLGLQSTLYGLQSLPAFQFVNTHIVGQLSGNKEHRDAYDAVYGAAGRTAGDWLLYGIPSNLLQGNIYSRGDINPRQITVLPTSMQEIPLVAGWGKFLGSMFETVKKINGGGNVVESLLQGLEHNGISRPLAGLSQVLQSTSGGPVYSTSNKGSILYSNDFWEWASLVRLAGGRPLDEAVTNDALYRVRTYEAARRRQFQSLAETVKTTLIGDETSSEAQVMAFAQRYAELGGKQAGFNKWMMDLYKSANVPQAEQLQMNLSNPFNQKMQLLMGGE